MKRQIKIKKNKMKSKKDFMQRLSKVILWYKKRSSLQFSQHQISYAESEKDIEHNKKCYENQETTTLTINFK